MGEDLQDIKEDMDRNGAENVPFLFYFGIKFEKSLAFPARTYYNTSLGRLCSPVLFLL